MAGAGAMSAYGAAVGDRIVQVFAQLPSGELEYCDSGWFESVVTVANEVQQLLPLYNRAEHANNGAMTLYGNDGVITQPHGVSARRQVSQNPGQWKFLFLVEEATAMAANGAVTLKDGCVFITKGTAAALTLADPTSVTDDGKELTILSTTAAVHTLSNAAGSGFNAGGAGSDIGTFGGAVGDGITLRAYGGKWLITSKTNVSLG